jgi:hypothetical protein
VPTLRSSRPHQISNNGTSLPKYHATQPDPTRKQSHSRPSAGLRPTLVRARIDQEATIAAAATPGASSTNWAAAGQNEVPVARPGPWKREKPRPYWINA